jgi:hypothetical protein
VAAWTLAVAAAIVTGWAAEQMFSGAVWFAFGGAEYLVGTEGVPEWTSDLFTVMVQVTTWLGAAAGALCFVLAVIRKGDGWLAVVGCGGVVAGLGLGALLSGVVGGRLPLLAVLLLVVGIVAVLLPRIVAFVGRRRRAVRSAAAPRSVLARGRVDACDTTMVGEELHWTVVVVFADAAGREHAARGRFLARTTPRPRVGDDVTVSYDREHPDRALTTDVRLAARARR